MRAAFRGYPTGVAVITTNGPDGPVGLTASSVASVSVSPPAISFSVMGTASARVIVEAPSLVVHLLGFRHAAVADAFARTGGAKFAPGQGWTSLPSGEPHLPEAQAALRVEPLHRLPVGGSTLVVATVVEVFHGPEDERLVYHSKKFHTL